MRDGAIQVILEYEKLLENSRSFYIERSDSTTLTILTSTMNTA